MLGEWMEREIEEQPALLARVAPAYVAKLREMLLDPDFEMVLLVARGSSDHAALYARYLIEVHLGIPVVLAAPSVLTRYGKKVNYPKCLAIGISQSGSAPDVSEVLGALREKGHTTLGITNTVGSRLASEAEHTLYLEAEQERSVAATKTYSTSLLAIYQLVRALGATLPEPRLPTTEWCERTRDASQGHALAVAEARSAFALGRGYSFSTANETALKLMECALIPCKAYSTADFEHGPKALAGEGSVLIAFDELSTSLAGQGATVLPAPKPPVIEELAPIWQILYGQWLALECARQAGENPDEPQFIQKITKTL